MSVAGHDDLNTKVMAKKGSGANVPPEAHNKGLGKIEDSGAGLKVLQDLRTSVKESEESARLGLGQWKLPIDGFRPEVADIFTAAAHDFDCHRDKAVVAGLTCIAAVSGKKVTSFYDHYKNHATIWSVMVDKQSGVKTSINNFFMDAVDAIDKQVRIKYNDECDEADQNEKPRPKLPSLYLTNDPTPERLNQMLEASATGITYYRDEVKAILNNLGRYRGVKSADSSEWQNFLEYFNNRLPKSDRKSDERLPVSTDIAFSLMGTIQEKEFVKKFRPIALSDDGGFDRFLFLACPYKKRTLLSQKPKMKANFNKWFTIVKDIDMNLKAGTEYKLSDEARQAYIEYMDEEVIKPEWEDPERTQFLTGYKQKNAHYILRLSMIIHVLNDYRAEEISLKEMDMAIRMMRVFNHYAETVYNMIIEADQEKAVVRRSTMNTDKPSKADMVRMFYLFKQSEGVDSGDVNQSEIARMFGMNQSQVSAIRKKMIADGQLKGGENEDSDFESEDELTATEEQEISYIAAESSEDRLFPTSEDGENEQGYDSPTPSNPPQIRSGDKRGGVNQKPSPSEDAGESSS